MACLVKVQFYHFESLQCKREGIFQKIQEEHGEGCNIHGFVDVKKVAGNIHFAPGQGFQHFNFPFLDLFSFQAEYNVSSMGQPLLGMSILFFFTLGGISL